MSIKMINVAYQKQLHLVDSVIDSMNEYLSLGARDMIFEVNVGDLVCKTVKATVNPVAMKGETLTKEEIEHILAHAEKALWHALNIQKSWFTMIFKITDGKLDEAVNVRFTENVEANSRSNRS